MFYLTPFFGGDDEVLVGGHRYEIGWYAIETMGMRIGSSDSQDKNLIAIRIAEARSNGSNR